MVQTNPLLDETGAIEAISKLYQFLTRLNEPVELIFLFGIAYDTIEGADRNRFASAISFFLRKDANEASPFKKVFVCIDPNLDAINISDLFGKLKKELVNREPYAESILGMPTQIGGTITYKNYKDYLNNKNAEDTISLDTYAYNNSTPSTFYEIYVNFLKKTKNGNVVGEDREFPLYYIYFMRYPVPMNRSPRGDMTEFHQNQLKIQEREKTIQTYLEMDECRYADDSFYDKLEDLALHPKVNSLIVGSAMTSHDHGFFQKGNVTYRSKAYDGYYVSNRYFETTCEVLTLLNAVYRNGKPVFFLTLDSVFATFSHQNVPKTSRVPYLVPFTEDTEFYINEPELLAPFSLQTGRFLGGRRKKTRNNRKKSRKTRKH